MAATLKQPELIDGIINAEKVSRGAFSAFGKYRYYLEKRLALEKSTAKISVLLSDKCGLTAGTISHTAYAAKAFAFVTTDHITEAEYDNMPSDLTRAFVQVIAPDAKARLTIEKAVGYLRCGRPPGEIAEEFDSLSTHGLTKADADKVAREQAAQEKAAQEQAAADKQAAAAAQKQADEDAAAAAAQAKAREDAKAAKVKPANVTKMPPQGPSLTSVGEQPDKLMESIGKLPVAQQVAFYSTTWKAADALLHDSLKSHLKTAA